MDPRQVEVINTVVTTLSVSGAIGNGVVSILTAFKSCFGHVSRSGESDLGLMDQSQFEVVPSGADDASGHSEARGGLELGDGWTGTSTTENGARLLPLLVTYSITEVPLVHCLQNINRALKAIRVEQELSLLKCFEGRLL
ncbi:hypothetical protein AMTR_s00031p00084800 [Amborella trichopoda]|uniref:Uncharacterized protein n=1 Tax=Amborella trichopoda TaxID=13333 RepID=U5CTE3_AMBTC|nr:hypothetical protein AMTR_s00031p00084800 [Amborella trichopoda]